MKKPLYGRFALSIIIVSVATLVLTCKQAPKDDSKTSGGPFNENIRPTDPRTPEEELAGFIVPDGFEITLFASEPDIDKPMNIAFDAKGRMWVTQSFEYPFPTADGMKSTDKLTIVEDTDGDGRADKFTVVTDTLNIPIGVLPTADGSINFSVPYVYRLFDKDRDDKFENKQLMFGPFGYQDTHGMVSNLMRGYDGWVHACHGFSNRSSFAGADGDTITLESGNTFRFRMDGSRVEQLTFGQVNPFGLVFDVLGYTYSTDSHSSPLYQLIRGADYPHFGKVPIMGFGPDMKSLDKEATALCGITQYADVQFPEEFRGNFFIGDVVNSRVHRYSATWRGSSPVGKSEVDFIKSEDPWFRPVNMKVGPDGALYVADFYNAIIGHYEVPLNHPKRDKQRGRIWRITYKGNKAAVPDLEAASAEELIKTFEADNLSVRMRALDQLTDRIGEVAVGPLSKVVEDASTTPLTLIHSLWALQRLGAIDDETLKKAITHKDSLVRLHGLRILVEKATDPQYYELINAALNDKSPHVQRVATELLMKYHSLESLESVLGVLHKTKPDYDNHLYYTARLVMRNLLRDEVVLSEAVTKKWSEQDAGLIAGVMVDVPKPASAAYLVSYMDQYKLSKEQLPPAFRQIARFTPTDKLQSVVDQTLGDASMDIQQKAYVYNALKEGVTQRGEKGVALGKNTSASSLFSKYASTIAEEIFKKYPATDTSYSDARDVMQRTAIEIAGDYKIAAMQPDLKLFINEGHRLGMTMRSMALRSLMKIDLDKNASIGANILQNDSMIEYQRRIAAVMSEFPGKAVNKSMESLSNIAQPIEVAVVTALAGSPDGKNIIFTKVKKGDFRVRTLTQPRVEELILLNASKTQQKEFEELTAGLEPISAERQQLVEKRLGAFDALDRKTLDLDSGAAVFASNCGACHKLGGQLGVGPQLDGIGKTGARGLIEKILDPNRNISKAFQNYTIQLKDGTVKTGLFRRDEGETKVFADLTGKEFAISKKDIAEQKLSKYTLMPDSFSETISERDFNQLINYLLSI